METNRHFLAFIADSKGIAVRNRIDWNPELNSEGLAVGQHAWNLTLLSGAAPPPTCWFRDLGTDKRTLELLNSEKTIVSDVQDAKKPLPPDWQDLIKACVLDQIFVRHNSAEHAYYNIARPLRVIGTCAQAPYPWLLTCDDVSLAVRIAKRMQPSGKLADMIAGVIADILDPSHLTNNAPLSRFVARTLPSGFRPSKFTKSLDEIRTNLEDRKAAEKLPDRRAFWELVRIIFTETPRSFLHYLLFAQVLTLMLTGHRGGESVLIPVDWKRFEDYFDAQHRPAGESGGVSQSLMLRYFAEKQQQKNSDAIAMVENVQHVPKMYEDILTSTLDEVIRVTAPLRWTLKKQVETGSLLPEFKPGELVPAVELYTCLTGNPFAVKFSDEVRKSYVTRYQRDHDPKIFEQLRSESDRGGGLDFSAYNYFNRLSGLPFRKADGTVWDAPTKRWTEVYFKVGEVEEFIRKMKLTKLSDTTPIKLTVGELAPWELMFLMPKRALSDSQEDGLCDITRYVAVGRLDRVMLTHAISTGGSQTLFSVYGQNDEDQGLRLTPHSLRHLLNTEYFRLGLSDTIITKQFGRHSLAESHVYDHRTLAEQLDQIELDPEVEFKLGEKAATVLRMMKAGKASGPIVEAYRRIQRTEGEDAAFDYLRAEADGFHATPYGHCINSFTGAACPKHLECFNGCRHLVADNVAENRSNLVQLKLQTEAAVADIEAKDSKSIGRENQLKHALTRLDAIKKILTTPEGQQVFPDGPDLSKRKSKGTVLDGDD